MGSGGKRGTFWGRQTNWLVFFAVPPLLNMGCPIERGSFLFSGRSVHFVFYGSCRALGRESLLPLDPIHSRYWVLSRGKNWSLGSPMSRLRRRQIFRPPGLYWHFLHPLNFKYDENGHF